MALGGDFLARIRLALEGKETVVTGLQDVQQAAQQLSKTKIITTYDKEGLVTGKKIEETFSKIGDQTKKATPLIEQFGLAMKRALIVAPVWMLMRAGIQAVIAPIKELVKAFFELDAGLAKVMTVTRISTSEQAHFYGQLTKAAWEYYQTSSASMKDITEAMYQIGTAGRTTTEILFGFNHILDLSIATFGSVVDAGRVLTGVLNVYGSSMNNLATSSEKMQYISDLLTYTWSTQQIELNEISTAVGYVGAAADTLNVDLKTLVGTIGFLNTGLLRGSKAGTSLLNAFLQIAQSSEKLRTLGVVFDPSKPLDLVDVMQQLHQRFLESGKSLDFTSDLFEIFGKRGGRAISMIIKDWDRWIAAIKLGDATFTNFAENIKNTAEKTLPKAFAKWFKLLSLSRREPGAGNPVLDWLNEQNKQLEENIESMDIYRQLVKKGFKLPPLEVAYRGGELGGRFKEIMTPEVEEKIKPLKEFFELIGEAEISTELAKQSEATALQLGSAAERAKNLFDVSAQLGHTWEEMVKDAGTMIAPLLNMTEEEFAQSKHLEKIYNYRLKNLNLIKEEEKRNKGLSYTLQNRLEQIDLETKYSLMKIAGAKEEEIAYIKINDTVKQLNDLAIKANESRRNEGKELYTMINVTDVLNGNWQKIISSGSTILNQEKDIANLEKLRVQILSERLEKLADEKTKMEGLLFQYEEADEFEKSRIRRQIELLAMTPKQVISAYQAGGFDARLIIDNIGMYSSEVKEGVAKLIAVEAGIDDYTKVLEQLAAGVGEVRGVPLQQQIQANVTQQANFGNVVISINPDDLKNLAELSGEELKRVIQDNPDVQQLIANIALNTKTRE